MGCCKNARDYTLQQTVENQNGDDSALHNFASSIAVNKRNTVLAVGLPDYDNGKVNVYNRSSESNNYILIAELVPLSGAAMDKERFGASVDVSEDGKYIYVGSYAFKVKTRYPRFKFITTTDYLKNDIVKYENSSWKARNTR